MITSNPFEVLGIDPRLVMSLTPRQLDQLIAVVGRNLKVMFHPDQSAGGNPRRFNEVNTACQALNRMKNPKEFEQAKRTFLAKTKRSKVLGLSLELETERLARSKTAGAFISYLLKTGDTESEIPLISRPVGWRVHLLDRVALASFPNLRVNEIGKGGDFYLDFTSAGNFRISSGGKSRREYHRTLVGAIPIEAFQKFGGLRKFLSLEDIPPTRRLTSRVDSRVGVGRDGDFPLYFTKEELHLMSTVRYEISPDRMAHMARYVTQEMKKDYVLFSVTEKVGGRVFYVEGSILGVQPLV